METYILSALTWFATDWLRTYLIGALVYSTLCVRDIVNTPWSYYYQAQVEDIRDNKQLPHVYYDIVLAYIPASFWSILWPIGVLRRLVRRTRFTLYTLGVILLKKERSLEGEKLRYFIQPVGFSVENSEKSE